VYDSAKGKPTMIKRALLLDMRAVASAWFTSTKQVGGGSAAPVRPRPLVRRRTPAFRPYSAEVSQPIVGVLVDCLIDSVRFFERCEGILEPDIASKNLEGIAWRVNEFLSDEERRELAKLIRVRAAAQNDPKEREWVERIPEYLGLGYDYHVG
jgi:hypothetical protein